MRLGNVNGREDLAIGPILAKHPDEAFLLPHRQDIEPLIIQQLFRRREMCPRQAPGTQHGLVQILECQVPGASGSCIPPFELGCDPWVSLLVQESCERQRINVEVAHQLECLKSSVPRINVCVAEGGTIEQEEVGSNPRARQATVLGFYDLRCPRIPQVLE